MDENELRSARTNLREVAGRRLSPAFRALTSFGPAAGVLLAGIVSFIAIQQASRDRNIVAHSHEVIEQTVLTLSAVQDAETGQRGFLITGDTSYLEPYTSALSGMSAVSGKLRELVRDDAGQQARLDTLDRLIERRLDLLAAGIAARKASAAEAVAFMRSNRGKAYMDSIRVMLRRVGDAESRLLAERDAAAQRSTRLALIVLVAGTFAAMAFALLLNGLIGRFADERARAASAMQVQNELLSNQAVELETQAAELQELAIELETANTNLSEQMHLAEAASSAKSDFLAGVSHELRTPLNAIDGYSELLLLGLRGKLTDGQEKDVSRIRKSSRHLLTLINQVLDMAKVESRQVDLNSRFLPVAPLLQDVEALIQPQMSAKKLRFSIGACDESVVVFVDPDRTKQILLNLLSNAQKFTDEGGAVSLRCEYAPHSILTISVSDTGRGIAPDKQAEIFEPFTQLNRLQTPDAHRGIGLGLSISRTLARAMGGDLTVESEVGKGSTFRLSLPTAPPAA